MKLFFRKTIKFNEKDAESKSLGSTWKTKCREWDRSLASIFGILAFGILMGIGIYNIFKRGCPHCKTTDKTDVSTTERNQERFRISKNKPGCKINSCDVTCTDVNGNEPLEDYINKVIKNCSGIILTLEEIVFDESQLNKSWLSDVIPDVTALTIRNCPIKEINDEAFADHPFNKIKTLVIHNVEIKTLRKMSFLGLTTLDRFELQNSDGKRTLEIEEGALMGMPVLTQLQLTKFILSPESIINLTGYKAAKLLDVQVIDLRANSITELYEYSFNNTPRLTSLYLSGSNIANIHQKAFWPTNVIQLLYLNDNGLQTLKNGTFNYFTKLQKGGLFLGGNSWSCKCPLQWLKDYSENTEYINTINPPLCNREKEFEEEDFCLDSTTTKDPETTDPSSSSSSSSTETTTQDPETPDPSSSSSSSSTDPTTTENDCSDRRNDIKIVQCKKGLPSGSATLTVETTHPAEIIIDGKTIKLKLEELKGETLIMKVVVVTPTDILKNYYLVWDDSEDKSKYGCESPIDDDLVLYGLKRGITYTFSVLPECESETSPKCTFGLTTLPEWESRTWIANQSQLTVIWVTILIVVCMILLTGFLTFLCIRRYPKLISGNKSVIIVKPAKTEESAPSREYEKPTYWEPYLVPSSQGYLTPKYHRYARIKYRPPLIRTVSEWSVSGNSIYADPNARHSREWKLPQLRKLNRIEGVEVQSSSDYRPPLPPPNNPGTSSCSSLGEAPEELIYSSV